MKKTYILLSMLTYGLLQPVIAFADSTEPKEIMDMFIGTLSVKDKKAILTRCDLAENTYTLKDADWAEKKAVENYLSKAEKLKQPIYAEVLGAYKQEADTNVILVDSIENITEAKSCHLNDLF
ncbi:hypothetical protein AYK86_10315 [Acinetobacter venetianus]|uniref:hypothetical protein n=1 Tax=Acinetobacter venetianus TaxID=52133 RepID=UPI000775E5EC|nr:hypothetical protein [Acinetobacter venetianus]KXO80428.1 hypothetical protein AYK86_10315 [Acinetobacter venetianus]